MTDRRRPQISLRKQPQQARSTELVAAILEAAVQVLVQEGAQRFTTARVAEKAGVSVGSVYQYFPNKAAILFRLQADEWKQTTEMLCRILEDAGTPPLERLRSLVHAFIKTEFEEAQIRLALNDAAPLYRDGAEAQEMESMWDKIVANFMREALPEEADAERALAGDLIITTLATVGEHLSRNERPAEAIQTYGDAMADMFCAYLKTFQKR
ncbi:MAG: Nucleoid occlusion factor SlmA [Herbaspirillum frisingense]|uniref:Nucleoid occlusion factor SlmA n=1 Tax=Herbaspirillum frisingense TaxID=92645 RepID=A0A7V8FUS7_9BURK|nr:MAG: Nucleoid occlusion factor SlmA [Herbaspirillum frisingense]